MSASAATSSPTPRRALVAAAVAFLGVALLGWGVLAGWGPLLRIDGSLSGALYAGDDRPETQQVLLQVATAPGSSAVRALVYLPVLIWLAVRRQWWTAGWVALAVGLIAPITTLLKEAVGRVRPPFADGGARYESLAFPSGHASGVATLVTVGLILLWPVLAPRARQAWLAVGVVLAVLVGLTRVWLGVHWLSDVLAGEALGLGWTLLVATVCGGLPGHRAALRPRTTAAEVTG